MSVSPTVATLKAWSNVGEVLFGDDLNANFDAIVNAYESHTHTEMPDLTGTETVSGLWSFSNVSGIKTDVVTERTAATGVTIDSVLLKDGGATFTDVVTIAAFLVLKPVGAQIKMRDLSDSTDLIAIDVVTGGDNKLRVGFAFDSIELGQSGGKLGFFGKGAAASTKQSVTGSRGGNAALASLLTALAAYGLITDGTS